MYNKIFLQLDCYLTQLQPFWQFDAFHYDDYPWLLSHPDLCDFLESLTDHQLQRYQQQPEQLYPKLIMFITSLMPLDDTLFAVDQLPLADKDMPFWLSTGIKGRKWSQISAFAEHVNDQQTVVEWCAGKGHLGRLISWQQQRPLISIEWQQTLCDWGGKEAQKRQVQQTFQQADVLKGQADAYIKNNCHAIALHACGDLHLRLIELAKKQRPKQLTISPCCYHLTAQSTYLPCSSLGKKSLLEITKQGLKLAVNKQVTTGKRQARLSEQEVLWRLAFDELQKHGLKTTNYFPLPSFPKALLSKTFDEFVLWVKQQKTLNFVIPENLQPFVALAQKRLKKVRRMELISQFFVRPLELWLVYDRALALQESGYKVNVSTFCDTSVTPRNLLIQARLTGE
ncbi:MAG: methyltransferase [Psychromonas sp.]